MINTCETTLIKVAEDPAYKICANFLILKLSLFIVKERFGCELVCVA